MLGKLSLDELRSFLAIADQLEGQVSELRQELAGSMKRRGLVESHLFGWGAYYSLTLQQQTALVLRLFGIDRLVVNAARQPNPQAALLELAERDIPDEWVKTEEQKKHVLALVGAMLSVHYNCLSVGYYGKWMNELITDGSDTAILQAVSIDIVASGNPVIQDRLAQAVFFRDERFLSRYRRALAGPSRKISRQINRVRVAAKILKDAGALPMPERKLVHLFCDELKLYPKSGDPGKALAKIIKLVTPTPTT